MKILEYVDERGYPRRVSLPGQATDPEMGVPISVDWEALEVSESFRLKLADELFKRGLVIRDDYLKSGSLKEIYAALQAVLNIDANTIQAVLSGKLTAGGNNGRGNE